MNTDAGALLKLAELLKRLEQCRDSRPLVYALDHTETFTVGDLRQATSQCREGGERSEVHTGVFPYQQTFDAIVAAVSLWPQCADDLEHLDGMLDDRERGS